MKRNVILLMLIGFVVLAFSGCATTDSGSPTHGELEGKKVTVSTGDYFEACDLFSPGTTVEYSFTSTKPVLFNIHYHKKRSKEYAVEEHMTDNASGTFVVDTKATYCSMWDNKNPKAIKMTYGMRVKE
jgi:hypothetical protein